MSFAKYRLVRKPKEESKEIDYSIYIKSIAPYFGPLLILFGVIRLVFFYSFFNITIVNYLELSEILTSFLDVLVIALLYFILITIFLIIQLFIESSSKPATIPLSNKEFWITTIIFLILYAGTLLLIINIVGRTKQTVSFLKHSFLLISVMAMALYFIFITSGRDKFKKARVAFSSLFIISLLFQITIYITYRDFNSITHNKHNINIKVTLDNGNLVNDSTHYYIGNTKNYLFYYDETNRRTYVYPMSRVKEISFDIPYLPVEKKELEEKQKNKIKTTSAPIITDSLDSIKQ